MGILTKVSLITKHTQYLSLLKDIQLPFPNVFTDFLSFTDLFNFDIEFFAVIFKNFPHVTFRMRFIVVCVLVPLLIVLLALIAFLRFNWILWGCLAFIGGMMVLLRVVTLIGKAGSLPEWFTSQTDSKTFTLTGVGVVVVVVVYFVAVTVLLRKFLTLKYLELVHSILHVMLEPTAVVSGVILLRLPDIAIKVVGGAAILWAIVVAVRYDTMSRAQLITFGIILVGVSVAVMTLTDPSPESMPSQLSPFGFFLLSFGLLGMVVKLTASKDTEGIGHTFTKIRNRVQQALDKGLLSITFFFLSMALVPVVTAALEMFMCVDFECPAGYRFNPFYASSDRSYSSDVSQYCDLCNVSSSSCAFDADLLCPRFVERRLLQHPDTVCDSTAQSIFIVVAGAIIAVFVGVFSWMYIAIVNDISAALSEQTSETYVDMVAKSKHEHEKYEFLKLEYELYMEKRAMLKEKRRQEKRNNKKVVLQARQQLLGTVEDLGAGVSSAESSSESTENDGDENEFDDKAHPPLLHPPTLLAEQCGGDVEMNPRAAATTSRNPSSPLSHINNNLSQRGNAAKGTAYRLPRMKPPAVPQPRPGYEDAFASVSQRVTPKASSLYSPYRHPMRQFLVIDNVYRVLLVVCTVIISPLVDLGGVLFMSLQFGMLLFLCVARPFHNRLELGLSILIAVCDAISGLYATLVWAFPSNAALTSEGVGIALILISFALPVVVTVVLQCVSLYTTYTNPQSREQKERIKKEKETKKQEIMTEMRKVDYEIQLASGLQEGPRVLDPLNQRKKQLEANLKEPLAETPEQITTRKLDALTKKRMLRVFVMFCTPVFIVAALVTVLLVYDEPTPNFRISSDPFDQSVGSVLAGRQTWPEFTAECCCFASANPISGYASTERWVCMDGLPSNFTDWPISYRQSFFEAAASSTSGSSFIPVVTLSKNRADSKAFDDGRVIRPVCGVRLPDPCDVTVSGGGDVSFICSPADYTETVLNATEYASKVLW